VDAAKLDDTLRLLTKAHPEALSENIRDYIAHIARHCDDFPEETRTALQTLSEDLQKFGLARDPDQYRLDF
jgi:t-SNARE complex subunit (syntaxin)